MNCELPDVQAGFRKGRGNRDQVANIHWIIKRQENSRKTSIYVLLTMPKPLTVDHNKLWKILQEMGISDHLTCPREICIHDKKQQLELDVEQQTGSKSRKEYVKAVYCHPAYLPYIQSTSCEMLGWMKHKL